VSTALLTPAEVAERFGVNVKTITRWADAGLLTCQRTLGGHRRFSAEQVERMIAAQNTTPEDHDD